MRSYNIPYPSLNPCSKLQLPHITCTPPPMGKCYISAASGTSTMYAFAGIVLGTVYAHKLCFANILPEAIDLEPVAGDHRFRWQQHCRPDDGVRLRQHLRVFVESPRQRAGHLHRHYVGQHGTARRRHNEQSHDRDPREIAAPFGIVLASSLYDTSALPA